MTEGPGDGSSPFMPRSPDPTAASAAAVRAATEVSRREIQALRELHDKDLTALQQLLDARFTVVDQDRARLWDKSVDIIARFTDALTDFRAEVDRRDQASRQTIEQRLADLDKAREIAARHIDAIPAQIRDHRDRVCRDFHSQLASEREYILGQIANALAETRRTGDVAQEKFAAVDALFASNALALAAALAAQEKAVAAQNDSNTLAIRKSEDSAKETTAANLLTAQSGLSSLANQVSDIKDRVVRIESTGVGVAGQRTDQRASIGTVIAAVATLVAVVSFILLVIRK